MRHRGEQFFIVLKAKIFCGELDSIGRLKGIDYNIINIHVKINEFIKTNDFTGKTVIPFCTSASSGLGESGELLQEMAGTGNWQDGQRFRSSASEDDVQAWIEDLGL